MAKAGIGINSGMWTELSGGQPGRADPAHAARGSPVRVRLQDGFKYVDKRLVALTLSFCPSESEHMPPHKAISAAAMCI